MQASKFRQLDLSKTKRKSDQSWLTMVINSTVIIFILVGVVIVASENPDQILFLLFVMSPIMVLLLLIEEVVTKIHFWRQIRILRHGLIDLMPVATENLSDFDVQLSRFTRTWIDNAGNAELMAIGSLLGYGRVLGLREQVVPIFELDKNSRREIPTHMYEIATSAANYDKVQLFRKIGEFLAFMASVTAEKENAQNLEYRRMTKDNFATFLRARAREIYQPRIWSASAQVLSLIRDFGNRFTDELAPWSALILFWLNVRLYFFGDRALDHRGWIFASEFELLAHRLTILANSVEDENWKGVVEVIIGSHRSGKYVPLFGIRPPSG